MSKEQGGPEAGRETSTGRDSSGRDPSAGKETSTRRESPTRRESAARRREKILEAAVMCFLEKGYHQTGVRDIAKRAGVSLGNLYNHFPGKHDVLAEIATLERAETEPLLRLLAKPAPALETLEAFIEAYATYLAVPENIILTIEITSEAIRKPDIAAMFVGNREALVAALTDVIRRGLEDGDLRAIADPAQMAWLILELIEGSAYRSVLGGVAIAGISGSVRDFIFAAVRKP